jgi:hypothetical protein
MLAYTVETGTQQDWIFRPVALKMALTMGYWSVFPTGPEKHAAIEFSQQVLEIPTPQKSYIATVEGSLVAQQNPVGARSYGYRCVSPNPDSLLLARENRESASTVEPP